MGLNACMCSADPFFPLLLLLSEGNRFFFASHLHLFSTCVSLTRSHTLLRFHSLQVLESSLLKLGAREPKFGASALSSATIAESVLPRTWRCGDFFFLPLVVLFCLLYSFDIRVTEQSSFEIFILAISFFGPLLPVCAARHEFTPWRLLPIHDGAGPRPGLG